MPAIKPIASKRIKTTEPWYPTADDGTVQVRFTRLSDRKYRVCVWGDDDFGLEKDFEPSMAEEARELYGWITHFTTQAQMRKWGMYNA